MDDPDTWSIPLENVFNGFEHRVPTDEDGEEIGEERFLHFDGPVLVFVWVQAELLEVFSATYYKFQLLWDTPEFGGGKPWRWFPTTKMEHATYKKPIMTVEDLIKSYLSIWLSDFQDRMNNAGIAVPHVHWPFVS